MEYDEDLGAILQKLNRKNRFDCIKPSTTLTLEEICDKMNGALQLKKRSKGLKKYPDCFTGEDAINWMISNEIIDTREKGVEMGSLMIYSGFVSNIQGLEYEDSGDMFYMFHKDAFMFTGAQSSKREEIHDEFLISTENIKKILERSGDENIFEESKEEIRLNEEKELIGMSFVKMIQYLTENDKWDEDMEKELVITFDLFVSQKDFLSLLQSRYCCIDPVNLNEEKKQEWKKEKTPLIQQRVLSILKRWLSYQSQDNLDSNSWFMKTVQSFMSRISRKKKRISEGSFMSTLCVSNINIRSISGSSGEIFNMDNNNSDNENLITDPHAKLVQEILGFSKDQKKKYNIPIDLPKSLKPKNTPIKTITDIPSVELARQFTMIGYLIYKNIRLEELLNKRWQHEKLKNTLSPNATHFIRYFNYLSLWVSTVILSEKKFKGRSSLIEYFIQVANSCKEINNFCGVMQIISGLRVTAVRRLKKSWKAVSSTHMQTWEDLQSVVSSDQNYNNLRTLLKESKPPTLPYLGLFLSDMFFIIDGNNDFLSEDPHIINLKKIKMVSSIIDKILSYQAVDYKFVHSSIIQRYIFDVQVKDEAELENLSLFLEPKI